MKKITCLFLLSMFNFLFLTPVLADNNTGMLPAVNYEVKESPVIEINDKIPSTYKISLKGKVSGGNERIPVDLIFLHGVLTQNAKEYNEQVDKIKEAINKRNGLFGYYFIEDIQPVYFGDFLSKNQEAFIAKSNQMKGLNASKYGINQFTNDSIVKGSKSFIHEFFFDAMYYLNNNELGYMDKESREDQAYPIDEQSLRDSVFKDLTEKIKSSEAKGRKVIIFAYSVGSIIIDDYLMTNYRTADKDGKRSYNNIAGVVTYGSQATTALSRQFAREIDNFHNPKRLNIKTGQIKEYQNLITDFISVNNKFDINTSCSSNSTNIALPRFWINVNHRNDPTAISLPVEFNIKNTVTNSFIINETIESNPYWASFKKVTFIPRFIFYPYYVVVKDALWTPSSQYIGKNWLKRYNVDYGSASFSKAHSWYHESLNHFLDVVEITYKEVKDSNDYPTAMESKNIQFIRHVTNK